MSHDHKAMFGMFMWVSPTHAYLYLSMVYAFRRFSPMCVVVFTYACMYINTDRDPGHLFNYNYFIVGIIYLNFGFFFFFLKDRKQEQKRWLLRKGKYKFVLCRDFMRYQVPIMLMPKQERYAACDIKFNELQNAIISLRARRRNWLLVFLCCQNAILMVILIYFKKMSCLHHIS